MSPDQKRLAELIADAGPGGVAVLTGAGISTASGIPDFRTPGEGLWSKVDPMKVAHIEVWREDPERFWDYYRHRLDIASGLEPNRAHEVVAELEHRGFLTGVVTQNIDGLHQAAGSKKVAEVHGSVRRAVCPCGYEVSRAKLDELFAEDGVPYCPECNHHLKPDVVLFGEGLPDEPWAEAAHYLAEAKLLIVIGSSLVVEPVASLPARFARSWDRRIAIVNKGWTPYDTSQSVSVHLGGEAAEELDQVLLALDEMVSSGPLRDSFAQ